MTIAVLPDDVISRIAAGEVVERPASVVKELIENAIDANATSIHVETTDGGRRLIRVSDNGEGILNDEVMLAFTRHATSKLRSEQDLFSILTLGFRGEALASIAAVSRLSISTRHREEQIGTQIRIEGGEIRQHKPVGAPAGTVMTVENLFFNTPARLKFLKSDNTEKRHILTVITRYAMAYPHIKFVLEQDGREAFRSAGSGQLADVAVQVFGLDNFRHMIEISGTESRDRGEQIRVWGYVSTPDLHRADRTRIILFVNGRSIQDSSLSHAATQAYHTLLDTGRYPYAVLMVEMPPDFVDVNVHPTKSEVRFQDSNRVFVAVQRVVREAVVAFASTTQAGRHAPGYPSAQPGSKWETYARPAPDALDQSSQMGMNLTIDDPGRFPSRDYDFDEDDFNSIPEGPGKPAKPRTLPPLRIVGQVGATYIIAEGPAGLYLIDQYAAHMRILHDELTELASENAVDSHSFEGQTVVLSSKEAQLLEKQLDLFNQFGFDIELFGANTFMVRALPALMGQMEPQSLLVQLLTDINDRSAGNTIETRLILGLARIGAVKSGQILSREDMQAIIRQLERSPEPRTSPDGRPTLLHMTTQQLAREFGRPR